LSVGRGGGATDIAALDTGRGVRCDCRR